MYISLLLMQMSEGINIYAIVHDSCNDHSFNILKFSVCLVLILNIVFTYIIASFCTFGDNHADSLIEKGFNL